METAMQSTTVEAGASTVPIYIMGKQYQVPATLTIMKALEHAGYQYIRGCGCRGGVCRQVRSSGRYRRSHPKETVRAWPHHP